MADCRPVIVNGEEDPVTVYPPGLDVAVNDVAAAPVAAAVKVTVAEPLLYALPVPTFVAVPIVGALGLRKDFVFCDADDPRIGMCISYTIINSVYSTYTSKNRHLDGPYTFNLII